MLKAELKGLIHAAVARRYPDAPPVDTTVDEPSTGIAADLASNAALALAKQVKRPPQEIALALAGEIGTHPLIEKIEVSRNGFLNFILQGSRLREVVRQICADPEGYGQKPEDAAKPR